MKLTTSRGVEVDVMPIALNDREKFLAMKKVNFAYTGYETIAAEEGGDQEKLWDSQWSLQEAITELCTLISVPADAVALPDCLKIISVLQTGELPHADFTGNGNEEQ